MSIPIVLKILGILLLTESAAMIPALFIALIYDEASMLAFLISFLITALGGFLLFAVEVKDNIIHYKESYAIVFFGWLFVSILGAFPFWLSGTLTSFFDAFFESVSGFSTTGATVINNVEILPQSILFWRSLTHWLGGMGILSLTLTIQPSLGTGAFQILKAESPGPIPAKLTPRIGKTVKILYTTYLIITLMEIILLRSGGMPLFDSIVNTFGTLGTGGFSIKNASIGAYNNLYFEVVITVFMIFSGVNFSLYYLVFKRRNLTGFFRDKEFQVYLSIIIIYTALITMNNYGSIYDTFQESLRHSSFQVASIITTTGFTTTDFSLWPDLSTALLLSLMFIGACAGSTSGSVKVIRIYLLYKYVKREISRLIHPIAVKAIKINEQAVEENILSKVMGFTIMYIFIFFLATILILTQGLDMISSATAVATTLGNVGPGLGVIGPSNTFAPLTNFSKIILAFCMLLGRLEIFTVISLLFPQSWKK